MGSGTQKDWSITATLSRRGRKAVKLNREERPVIKSLQLLLQDVKTLNGQ